MNTSRPRYPSDLTDRQWHRAECVLPERRHLGRPRSHALRDVVDAINYRWETGCPWRMLPHDYPPWGTVYAYFRAWQRRGVLSRLRDTLLRRDRRERAFERLNPQRNPNEANTPS